MTRSILGSVLFVVLAPGTVAGLGPHWIQRAGTEPGLTWRLAGAMLLFAGLVILMDSFARFAIQGLGTPAPIAPTTKLIVSGLYRHVRNPMYVAVLSLIFGQALLWGDVRVAGYGVVIWMLFHLFVLLYEEPTLKNTFRQDYPTFKKNVPRWIPRLNPWSPADVSH